MVTKTVLKMSKFWLFLPKKQQNLSHRVKFEKRKQTDQMPEQPTSKLTSLGPGECCKMKSRGSPCFDLCLSECERVGVCHQTPCVSRGCCAAAFWKCLSAKTKVCVTSTDNFLVVQSVRGESSQRIYCMLTVFLVWFDQVLWKNTNQENSLGTSPNSENRGRLCHCGFLVHMLKCVCVQELSHQYSQYSSIFFQRRKSILMLNCSWSVVVCVCVCYSFRPVFHCGGHLVTDSGIVASEGFPSPYKPNSKCIWYITVSHFKSKLNVAIKCSIKCL